MRFVFQIGFLCFLFSCNRIDKSIDNIFYSKFVKDSFEVYISTPKFFDTAKRYNVVYYLDANLTSGKKLRELLDDNKYNRKVNETIFVGVGHIGNYRKLRRRDFITPQMFNGDAVGKEEFFGQISNFHNFRKLELIPRIDSLYRTNRDSNSVVGHSLGGLFVFYSLFKNDSLFKRFYAFSPSLWVNDNVIYDYNNLNGNSKTEYKLYFSVGGFETLNWVKSGADSMNSFLTSMDYGCLSFRYKIHSGETHNSNVDSSFYYLLSDN